MGNPRSSNKCSCYAEFCSTVKYLRHLDTKQWAPSATKQEPGCSCEVNGEQRIYKGNTSDAEWAARHNTEPREKRWRCRFLPASTQGRSQSLPSPDLSVTVELGVHDGLSLKENKSASPPKQPRASTWQSLSWV